MNKKSFLNHFVVIGFGTIVNMLLGLLTTPIITRIVSPVEYGQLSIFTMYSNIAVMVLCLGLDQALVRFYYDDDNIEYKKSLLYNCIRVPIIVCFFLGLLVCLLTHLKIIKFEFSFVITVLLCLYTLIQIVYRFSTLLIRLEYNSKLYSKLNIYLKLFYIVFCVPLIIIVKQNYILLLVISTVLSVLICLIISLITQKKFWVLKNRKINLKKYNNIKFKLLFRYSAPFIISMGLTTLFQAIDKFTLNYFCDYSVVGIYSSAMNLVHIFAIVQTTFNALWSPLAVEHYTKNPEDKVFFKKVNGVMSLIMIFLGFSLILFKDIFSILLGEKYRSAAYIIPFLMFNPIMYTISETTVNGLVFKKKSKYQVLVALIACVSNLIGNIILVPKFGCKGAAISTGISYIIFFAFRTYFSSKFYNVDYNLKKFYFIIFILCCYAFYNTFYQFNILTIFGYVIGIVLLLLLYNESLKQIISYLINYFRKVKK